MFIVGKRYEIRMIEGGDECSFVRVVEKYEHPLVKFADVDIPPDFGPPGYEGSVIPGEIINVTSPNFISAVIKETDEAPTAKKPKPDLPPQASSSGPRRPGSPGPRPKPQR